MGQAAALAALDDAEHVRRSIENNQRERRRLVEGLNSLGLRPAPSETNFVFVETGPETPETCDALMRAGVIVRPLGWMGLPEAMRVTVGVPAENGRFLAALEMARSTRTDRKELAGR